MSSEAVRKALEDWRTAGLDAKLTATLGFLEKLTLRPTEVTPADAKAVLATGVSRQALEDAITVCAAFCMIDRVADAMNFHVGEQAMFDAGAKALLSRGYKL